MRRRVVGGAEGSADPCNIRDWTVRVARTWCDRSRAMMDVFGATMGLEKIDWDASGSIYYFNLFMSQSDDFFPFHDKIGNVRKC